MIFDTRNGELSSEGAECMLFGGKEIDLEYLAREKGVSWTSHSFNLVSNREQSVSKFIILFPESS